MRCSKILVERIEQHQEKHGLSWSGAVEDLCLKGLEFVGHLTAIENKINSIDENEQKVSDTKDLDNTVDLW